MADETPEQQLLKLIEQPGGTQNGSHDPKSGAGVTPHTKSGFNYASLLTVSGWKGVLSYAREHSSNLVKQNPEVYSLKRFNRLLKIMIIVLGALMLVYIGYSAFELNSEYHSLSDFSQKQMADLPISSGRMLDPNFFEDIAKRNIFAPIVRKAEPEIQESAITKAKLSEMVKDIKLTGISVNPTDPNRTFCMIEDLKKSSTSFLKVGDTVAGFTISNIGQDSVELTYQRETIELR